jgi:phage FluMu gp28-like protein
MAPNGWQLSCGADNFQNAPNEKSSKSKVLVFALDLYSPCLTYSALNRQLELLVRAQAPTALELKVSCQKRENIMERTLIRLNIQDDMTHKELVQFLRWLLGGPKYIHPHLKEFYELPKM